MAQSGSRFMPSRPVITVALIGTGSVLTLTGLTMLVAGLSKSAAVYKAWKLAGISSDGVSTLHQIAAVGFMGAAGTHIVNNRRVISRHLQSFTPEAMPATAQAKPA